MMKLGRVLTVLAMLAVASGCNCNNTPVGEDGGTGGGATGGGATGGGTGGETGGGTGGGTGGATGGGTGGGTANHAPVLSPIAAVAVNEGATSSVALAASDVDGDTVSFSLTSPPSFVTLSGSTISIAPGFTDSGSYTINVVASDGVAQTNGSFSVTVNNVNRPPVVTQPTAVTLTAGTSQNLVITATDPDGDTLTYSVTGNPTWATLSGNALTLAPGTSNIGAFSFVVSASDGSLSDSKTAIVTVTAPANQPPTVTLLGQVDTGGVSLDAGVSVYLTPKLRATVTDPEGGLVRLQAEVVLSSASFTGSPTTTGSYAAGGQTDLTLTSLSPGTYKWQVRGEDAQNNLSAWTQFNSGNAAFTILAGAVTGTVAINSGATATNSASVTLTLSATSTSGTISQMRFSNDGISWSAFEAYATSKTWTLSTGSSTATVYVEFKDSAGSTGQASSSILYDASAPTISSVSINGGATAANSSTLTFAVTAADTGGTGVAKVCFTGTSVQGSPLCVAVSAGGTYPVTLAAGEGLKIINVTVVDGAGNTSSASPATITIDTVAPTISGVSINAGAVGTSSTAVSVGVTATDNTGGSGLADLILRNQPTAFGTSWAAWTGAPTYAQTLAGGDGTATVGVKVRDAAGNVSTEATDSILLDTTAPTGSFSINGGAANTNSLGVTLSMSATDPSGVAAYCAKETNTAPVNAADPCWTAMATTAFNLAAGADGTRTVYLWWKDGLGNFTASALSDTIILDKTAPTVTVSGAGLGINGGAVNTNGLTLTLNNSASDGAGTGLAFVCVSTTNPPPQPSSCVTYSPTPSLTIPAGDGTKTLYITVIDVAGNTSTMASDTILLDQTAPTISAVSINTGAVYTNTTAVTVGTTATDPGGANASGLSQMQFSNDGVTWQTAVAFAISKAYTLQAVDGPRAVSVRVIDAAGNTSAPSSDAITLDTTLPTGTVSINAGAAATNLTSATLSLSASDATTSVVAYCANATNTAPTSASDACWTVYPSAGAFTLPGGDGTKTAYVWFKDSAGNYSSSAATDTIILDQTVPTVTVTGPGLGLQAGATATNQLTLTMNNSAADTGGSGLATVCVGAGAAPPVPPAAGCVAYTATPSVTITGPDGTKTVSISVYDGAGNLSAFTSDTIVYDATPPTVGPVVTINGGQANTNNPAVSIASTATDATSGVSTMQFSEDNGVTWSAEVAWLATQSYTLAATGDGTRTVWVRVKDGAGNYSVAPYPSDFILLDTTPPACSISTVAYTQTSPVSVNISPTEAGSGPSKMYLMEQSSALATPATPSAGTFVTTFATPVNQALAAVGSRKIFCWLLDNAGNVSPVPGTATVIYDNQAPSTPAAPGVVPGHRSVTLTWTNVSDVGAAGVKGYQVGVGKVAGSYAWQTMIPPGVGTTTTQTLTLGNSFTWHFAVRAIDNANNVGAASVDATGTPNWPFNFTHHMPTSSTFRGATTINTGLANRYLGVGDLGTLFVTDNLGTSWARRDPMTDGNVNAIAVGAVTGTTGLMAVGDSGHLAFSGDYGDTWTLVTNTEAASTSFVPPRQHHLYGYAFAGSVFYGGFPSYTAYDFVAVGEAGTILHGATGWIFGASPLTSMAPVVSPTTNTLRAVARCSNGISINCDGSVVVAVGDNGTIIRSTDRGSTWTAMTAPVGYTTSQFLNVAQVPATNQMVATVWGTGGQSPLLISSDGGQTWSAVALGVGLLSAYREYGLYVSPTGTVWMSGYDSGKFFSNANVIKVTLPTTMAAQALAYIGGLSVAYAITGTSDTAQMVFGDFGQTLVGNGSGTFTGPALLGTSRLYGIATAGTNYALVAGTGGYLASTSNGGASWSAAAPLTGNAFLGVSCVDNIHCLAAGLAGTLEYYVGAGPWTLDATPFSANNFRAVSCQTGVAAGLRNCLVVGDNGTVGVFNGATGATTAELVMGSPNLYGVDFYNSGGIKGIVVGAAGYVRTLTGTTWNLSTTAGTANLWAVHAIRTGTNAGTAIAVGDAGAVWRSTNHGATWTQIPSFTTTVLNAVSATENGSTWVVAGNGGQVFRSTDNGINWSPALVSSTNLAIGGAAITNTAAPYGLWLAGDRGMVLYSGSLGAGG